MLINPFIRQQWTQGDSFPHRKNIDDDDDDDNDSKDRYDHDDDNEDDKQWKMSHKIIMYNLPVQTQIFCSFFVIYSSKAHT